MESVIPLKVLGIAGLGRRSRKEQDCTCPVLETTEQEVLARVEAGLESLRQSELRRRRRGLKGLTEHQRDAVERFTEDLLRHAVVERIQRIVRERSPEDGQLLHEIREMFPTRR